MLEGMWTLLRERLTALFGDRRRPREAIRLMLPGRGPMRVVYDKAVVHETFSFRARVLQRALRITFKPLLRYTPLTDRSLAAIRSIDKLSARRPRSRYVEPVEFELGGVRVESMTHRYGPTSDMTILYLHGGGFFSCGIESHRRICERLALKTGATVISVDYVQLPEGSIADSVQDAITAYEALLEIAAHPDKIVVAGDSAGGYLTMKIAELATRRGLQAPAALLGFSPLLSVDPDREDKGVKRISRVRDAYLPARRIAQIRERWLPEGSAIEGYASPLHASAYISSPTFLVAVEDEILRPEVEAMTLLLVERGVGVETHLWRKLVHAFPVLADALPESDLALQLAADFARRAVGELDRPAIEDAAAHDEPIVGELVPDDSVA
jgi:acetyl esterase/lipase